jgi:XTP/dITP diphosphohydrolase
MPDPLKQTLVIATRNQGKVREMRALLRQLMPRIKDITLASLRDFPDAPAIEESGATFHENARIKALTIAAHTGCLTLGDDSGLEVDALGGAPGVYSARYAGPHARDDENNQKLLAALRTVPPDRRSARFVCVIALALPDNVLGLFEGVCHGVIGAEPRGSNGFGYDPLFVKTDYGKTFAELSHSVKNRISHRALAVEKAAVMLERYLERMRDTAAAGRA